MQNDEMRKRILVITKNTSLNEEDRMCLLHIFSLLTNLEACQEQKMLSFDDVTGVGDVVRIRSFISIKCSAEKNLSVTRRVAALFSEEHSL